MNGWQDNVIETPRADLAVVIGRFQPVHNGHMELFRKAAEISKNRLILVGSSHIARDTKNPFTFEERRDLLHIATNPIEPDSGRIFNFDIAPIMDDMYNDQLWVGQVQSQIDAALQERGLDKKYARVVIVGYRKDASSFYLDFFPNYKLFEINGQSSLSGTDLRDRIFDKRCGEAISGYMPNGVYSYIADWKRSAFTVYDNLAGELEFLKTYKQQFLGLKYPPMFVTADAVVINHGHILLVKRRSHPGKGLWALPGGYVNYNERIDNAIIRELKEETRIDVNDILLRASLKGTHVFDAPFRSLRGRIITHAGLFVLNTLELPKVKGSDDAEKAKWIPLSQFYDMTEELFEDHYSIGTYMIGRAG